LLRDDLFVRDTIAVVSSIEAPKLDAIPGIVNMSGP
jgi:hypothetical protein